MGSTHLIYGLRSTEKGTLNTVLTMGKINIVGIELVVIVTVRMQRFRLASFVLLLLSAGWL